MTRALARRSRSRGIPTTCSSTENGDTFMPVMGEPIRSSEETSAGQFQQVPFNLGGGSPCDVGTLPGQGSSPWGIPKAPRAPVERPPVTLPRRSTEAEDITTADGGSTASLDSAMGSSAGGAPPPASAAPKKMSAEGVSKWADDEMAKLNAQMDQPSAVQPTLDRMNLEDAMAADTSGNEPVCSGSHRAQGHRRRRPGDLQAGEQPGLGG